MPLPSAALYSYSRGTRSRHRIVHSPRTRFGWLGSGPAMETAVGFRVGFPRRFCLGRPPPAGYSPSGSCLPLAGTLRERPRLLPHGRSLLLRPGARAACDLCGLPPTEACGVVGFRVGLLPRLCPGRPPPVGCSPSGSCLPLAVTLQVRPRRHPHGMDLLRRPGAQTACDLCGPPQTEACGLCSRSRTYQQRHLPLPARDLEKYLPDWPERGSHQLRRLNRRPLLLPQSSRLLE